MDNSARDNSSDPNQPPQRSLRVLIAERHELTLRMLQVVVERAGATAHTVSAREELASDLRSHRYGLLLLDSGMATAAELREWAPDGILPPIAIIGGVNDGDDFCDCEHVGRPVALERVAALMAHWTGSWPLRLSESDPLPPLCAAPVLEKCMIDDLFTLQAETYPGAVPEMIQIYLQNTPERLDAIRSAIGGADYFRLRWNAHALKGSSGIFGARWMVRLCEELHLCGRREDLHCAGALLELLTAEYELVRNELLAIVGG